MLRPLEEGKAEADDPPPISDASAAPALLHPYHAYVSPRGGLPDTGTGDNEEEQQPLGPTDDPTEEYNMPVQQLRAYLRRQEVLRSRPWWRLGSASYLLLVLVGLCYLGGRGLLQRSVEESLALTHTDAMQKPNMVLHKINRSRSSGASTSSRPLNNKPPALAHSKLQSSSLLFPHAFLPAARLKVSP